MCAISGALCVIPQIYEGTKRVNKAFYRLFIVILLHFS